MELTTIWFVAIAFLWTGYFVLEGFDFGVGVLLPLLGRREHERRAVLGTIGPVWDGNEVWLIVAVGASFAAFPAWYAGMLSGFYLPMLAVIVALILRGVALEYRSKVDSDRWRAWCDRGIFAGSLVPAFVWGSVFTTMVRGVPIDAEGVVRLGAPDAAALLGGAATLALFTLHGAVFLALKIEGPLRRRARRAALAAAAGAVPVVAALLLVIQREQGDDLTATLGLGAIVALGAATFLTWFQRDGWAFAATAGGIVLTSVTVFLSLWPNVLPSSISPAYDLTAEAAAAGPYTLTIMSWAALVLVPFVLAYQAWTYWVFRKRLVA
ncbi:cytochrome d ubiquinol oxidase subunit II [Bailinhaonella thermotolerans]|uniref:Cytochrome d ubiquinol oxidase subunit II n=1 Tax=Bailinhaonella thermotolerans TaxID=1070861 RepID=A0A3A4A9R9_9ACTN|nr:cytochrome d ubiquinol oxidase subunit II [Bailinhaonella thermotolerans]RJL23647.1 cytochrome d ubiquinol oxidase subunit II [Bailinhaonella thermotolerans]